MTLGIPLNYYDKILAAVAASLGAGAMAGMLTAVSFNDALLSGALFATVFVYHALFRNPPRPVPSSKGKAAAIVWHAFLGSLLVSALL